ncbi:tyrosine-type recombinase/integrase [Methanoculleus sp. UBA374]|jgi:integrase|uniref:tyrosine-type recombinase/integrase n=3 Tax=Methanoculleus TaxID=45989 RepID=UPI00319E6A5D
MTRTNHTTHLAFSLLHRSRATQSAVRKSLRDYLRFITAAPDASDTDLLKIQSDYLKRSPGEVFGDLVSYLAFLTREKHNSPNTIRLKLHYTRAWLLYNDIRLSPNDEKILRNLQPRTVIVTEEAELSRETIREIAEHADLLTRTLIVILASSGMRISELLGVVPEDIVLGDPGEIRIPRERMKSGKAHTYYFSREAGDHLRRYLLVRDELYSLSRKRTNIRFRKTYEDRRVFPIVYGTAANRFVRAAKRAGVHARCSAGNRSKITYHSIRKWTESTMKLHISINLANEFIGHDEGLSVHYRRYNRKQMREAYKIVEPYLSIYTDIPEDVGVPPQEEVLRMLVRQQEEIMERLAQIETILANGK